MLQDEASLSVCVGGKASLIGRGGEGLMSKELCGGHYIGNFYCFASEFF